MREWRARARRHPFVTVVLIVGALNLVRSTYVLKPWAVWPSWLLILEWLAWTALGMVLVVFVSAGTWLLLRWIEIVDRWAAAANARLRNAEFELHRLQRQEQQLAELRRAAYRDQAATGPAGASQPQVDTTTPPQAPAEAHRSPAGVGQPDLPSPVGIVRRRAGGRDTTTRSDAGSPTALPTVTEAPGSEVPITVVADTGAPASAPPRSGGGGRQADGVEPGREEPAGPAVLAATDTADPAPPPDAPVPPGLPVPPQRPGGVSVPGRVPVPDRVPVPGRVPVPAVVVLPALTVQVVQVQTPPTVRLHADVSIGMAPPTTGLVALDQQLARQGRLPDPHQVPRPLVPAQLLEWLRGERGPQPPGQQKDTPR